MKSKQREKFSNFIISLNNNQIEEAYLIWQSSNDIECASLLNCISLINERSSILSFLNKLVEEKAINSSIILLALQNKDIKDINLLSDVFKEIYLSLLNQDINNLVSLANTSTLILFASTEKIIASYFEILTRENKITYRLYFEICKKVANAAQFKQLANYFADYIAQIIKSALKDKNTIDIKIQEDAKTLVMIVKSLEILDNKTIAINIIKENLSQIKKILVKLPGLRTHEFLERLSQAETEKNAEAEKALKELLAMEEIETSEKINKKHSTKQKSNKEKIKKAKPAPIATTEEKFTINPIRKDNLPSIEIQGTENNEGFTVVSYKKEKKTKDPKAKPIEKESEIPHIVLASEPEEQPVIFNSKEFPILTAQDEEKIPKEPGVPEIKIERAVQEEVVQNKPNNQEPRVDNIGLTFGDFSLIEEQKKSINPPEIESFTTYTPPSLSGFIALIPENYLYSINYPVIPIALIPSFIVEQRTFYAKDGIVYLVTHVRNTATGEVSYNYYPVSVQPTQQSSSENSKKASSSSSKTSSSSSGSKEGSTQASLSQENLQVNSVNENKKSVFKSSNPKEVCLKLNAKDSYKTLPKLKEQEQRERIEKLKKQLSNQESHAQIQKSNETTFEFLDHENQPYKFLNGLFTDPVFIVGEIFNKAFDQNLIHQALIE